VLKAPRWHGSRALRLARDAAEEETASAELAAEFGTPLLVEEFVPGKEVAVAMLGRPCLRMLPPVEVDTPSRLYDRRDKWSAENPRLSRARLPGELEREIIRSLAGASPALGLRDLARFDLRVRGDGSWVALEVNIRPSIEPGGILELAAALEGLTLEDAVLGLLAAAGGPGRLTL
jgi:D-alanine-D-alanine ligase